VQYGTIQISNGISCDVHSLFTPDAEIMPGMLRVLSYPPSRRAGNAELSLFSWQKEHIPVKEENLSQIPLGNVYIYILGLLWPGPASLKLVQENFRRNIRRLGVI